MKTLDKVPYKEWLRRSPYIKLMGIKLLSSRNGKSVMCCPVRRALKNFSGIVHGGVMGALLDVSVSIAVCSVIPHGSRITTVEYNINLLKPISDEEITAHGSVIRLGKTIAVGRAEIRNAEGELVAFGSATFYIFNAGELPPEPNSSSVELSSVRSFRRSDSPGIKSRAKWRKKAKLRQES